MTPAMLLLYVQIAEQLGSSGFAWYQRMKALAAEAGVTDAEWAAAKAENLKTLDEEIVELGGTLPSMTPVTPAPAPVDPSSVEYNTQPEAVAAVTPDYPNVDRLADGKFVVWPNIGSLPGSTHVFP